MSNPAHSVRYTSAPSSYVVNPNDYYNIGMNLYNNNNHSGGYYSNNNSKNNKNGYIRSDEVVDSRGCCEQAIDCSHLPDACTNEVREERLIERQQRRKDENDNRIWIHRFIERERNLIIACVVLVVFLNTTVGRYVLYPFKIFSTWVHEMGHGIAAILMGGNVSKLQIFKDGSGLCYFSGVSNDFKRGIVSSAGYCGTSLMGCIMLLFRRTTLGPTIGTIGIGACLVLSCAFWVRNTWGLLTLLGEGFALLILGWKLPAHFLDNLYSFLAATCCLNAFESIQDLFAIGSYYVGGELVDSTDAHTVADVWGGDYRFWAILWLCLSCVLTAVGIVFAFNARETRYMNDAALNGRDGIIDAKVTPVSYVPTRSSSRPQQQQSQPSRTAVPSGAAVTSPATTTKPKRKWFGFLKREKKLEQATVY